MFNDIKALAVALPQRQVATWRHRRATREDPKERANPEPEARPALPAGRFLPRRSALRRRGPLPDYLPLRPGLPGLPGLPWVSLPSPGQRRRCLLPCRCPAALPASLGSPLLPAAPWASLTPRGPAPAGGPAGGCLKLWTVRPNENAPRPKPRGAVFRRGR